jgi:DNA-binding CsgD family transcriptional regulator
MRGFKAIGGCWLTSRALTPERELCLTHREVAILCLIAEGQTSAQAANSLHISRHTVAQHIAAMLRKSAARNRGELIARAFVVGLLATDKWPPVPVAAMPTTPDLADDAATPGRPPPSR